MRYESRTPCFPIDFFGPFRQDEVDQLQNLASKETHDGHNNKSYVLDNRMVLDGLGVYHRCSCDPFGCQRAGQEESNWARFRSLKLGARFEILDSQLKLEQLSHLLIRLVSSGRNRAGHVTLAAHAFR